MLCDLCRTSALRAALFRIFGLLDGPLKTAAVVGCKTVRLLRDPHFAKVLRRRLRTAIEQQSVQMDPLRYLQRGRWQRALDLLALVIMRMGLFVVGRRY